MLVDTDGILSSVSLRRGERNPFNVVHNDLANYSRYFVVMIAQI
jgi:hypothetical protein